MMKKLLSLALLMGFSLCGMNAQPLKQIPLDPKVRMGTLDNGLTYYIRHNEWPEKRADFYIAQKVGSMQEEDNQRGLAHFLEHMCFNGTTHFPGNALKQYLERIGVKFGENLNAYTSFDETVYNVNNVNVEIPGALDSCLLILHDWSHDLSLDGEEIDKERGVINEEWRLRRTAMQRMLEGGYADLFPGSKYAHRMVIGTMDVVMNFPHEDLRNYYRRWYRPDLQGIVVVGDVDVDQMEQKIRSCFADIAPAPAEAPQREYYPVPDSEGMLVSIQKDKEQPTALAQLMFKTDPLPRELKATVPYAGIIYVRNAIQNMMADRLKELMLQPNPPFVHGSMGHSEYMNAKTKDAFTATVVLKEGEFLSGLAAIYREVIRAKRFGFTVSEYERFKQEFQSQLDAALAQKDKIENTSYVQEYVRHFLDCEPAAGIEWECEVFPQYMQQVPLEALNKYMEQSVTDSRALIFLLPEKDGIQIPTREEILKTLADVDAEQMEGYAEEVNTDPLVPELNPDVTVKRIKDDIYGSKLVTLSNGIKAYILKTDYAPNQISMKATSWGGTSLYPNDEYILSSNSDMVSIGGWGAFSATELQKKLAGIQASASPSVSDQGEQINGSCVKKDFETMLQLTYLCFTSPRRDDDTFQSTMERLRASLKNKDLNPQVAFQDSIASVVYGNNIRALRFKTADVDRIDYDRILQIYGERFANAADFDFYFVGDLDADTVAPLLAKYLGSLPVNKKREKYKNIDYRMADGEHICIFDKEQDTPNALYNFYYHASLKENLRNALLVSFLGQALKMLFTESVREDEGGAYGVPVRVNLSDYPEKVVSATIQLPTSPEKVERMTQVIYDGLEKMCNEGPSDDQMQKIREYMVRSHSERLKDNGYWMNQLVAKSREGYDFVKGYDATLQKITSADVQKLAQKLFHSGNHIVVGMKTPSNQ